MSALGHLRTSLPVRVMSVLPLKADIRRRDWHVRFVPLADIAFLGEMRLGDRGLKGMRVETATEKESPPN